MDKEELKRELLAYQAERRLNDTQLAALIGITAVCVANIRRGKHGLGLKTLQGIRRGIHEMAQEAEELLTGEAT